MSQTSPETETLKLEWREGAPPKPWSGEWFIAETTYGDRVVLTSLPEEWTYDFKTADDTYIKRDKIKRWMQFPDSKFIAPEKSDLAQSPADEDAQHVRSALETLSDPLLIDEVDGVGMERLLKLVGRMRQIAATALLHLPASPDTSTDRTKPPPIERIHAAGKILTDAYQRSLNNQQPDSSPEGRQP